MARNADGMAIDELIELLKLGTDELYYAEAAVRLLVRHGYWLEQPEFRRFIEVFDHVAAVRAGILWADAAAALGQSRRRPPHGDPAYPRSSGPESWFQQWSVSARPHGVNSRPSPRDSRSHRPAGSSRQGASPADSPF